jgi:hypothetical protein
VTLAAGLLEVFGVVAGVVLALVGAAVAVLGGLAAAEGVVRRGLLTLVAGSALGASGLWLVGLL